MTTILTVLGIACLLYGLSVMLIWSGTGFFAVWFAIGIVLLSSAWALHAGWWNAMPVIAKRSIGVIAAAVVAVCAITQGLALSCFNAQGEDDLDCIIVLGAQVRETGPTIVLQNRLDTAYDYLTSHPRTRCIVSGGQGFNEHYPEAQVMAEYLQNRGIEATRITVEDQSTNTIGNICNCKQFVDPLRERVGIVTNNFHVFRGTAIARKQGYEHVCGIAAPSAPWYLPNNLLRETFGIAKDFLQGNL